jgi:hypothetical protein
MDFSGFYLDDNILFNIFSKLSLKEKIKFSHINSLTYNNYVPVIKNEIYKFINNDYYHYYLLLKLYNYDNYEINKIGSYTISNMKIIKDIRDNKYRDLRFLFEIILKGYTKKYDNDNNVIDTIINKMINCKHFNRFETIRKIYQEPILFSLRRDITIKEPKDYLHIYII